METVRVGEIDLNVAILGSGPPLVLLHGLFIGSLAQWYFTVAAALAESHTVVMFDLRGHGRSERVATGYDLNTLVGDLRGLVEVLQLEEPISVAGHSYGGLIALAYAQRYSVRRLGLVDVPLPGQPRDAALASPQALLDAIPGPVRGALLGGGRRSRRLLASLSFLGAEATVVHDMEVEPPLVGLASLNVPTLAVYGEASGCVDSLDVLKEVLPQLEVCRLEGGHFLPIEAPVELTAVLVEFFGAGPRS